MATLTPREERGLIISGTQKLTQKGKVWIVPSQNGSGKYTVCPDSETPYCSCPDHEETGLPCKHVFAVRFTMKREQQTNGTVTETETITFTKKKTYQQDWPMYSLAQIEEKKRFLKLLFDLCVGLPEPVPSKMGGRAATPMADMIFACAYKVYSTMSARRFGTDLHDAHEKGYLTTKLHPIMVGTFLGKKHLTPVLHELIVRSSLPLKAIETTFAPDSTGFSVSRFVRWFDEKYGRERSGKDWVKAHAIFGVKTNVATSVEIAERNAGDCPMFKPLVEKTAENFTVKEVPADKAYLSHDNFELINNLGGTAYIPFKSNSQPGEGGDVWEKMFHFYSMHREEFNKRYHQRSNAESGFSMLKAKFKDNVRSTTDVAMKNEVLCKFLCHNICCVIQSQLELGIVPVFWKDAPQAETVARPMPTPAQETVQPTMPEPATAEQPPSAPRRVFICGA